MTKPTPADPARAQEIEARMKELMDELHRVMNPLWLANWNPERADAISAELDVLSDEPDELYYGPLPGLPGARPPFEHHGRMVQEDPITGALEPL
jgi:hypothetical protein